LAEEITIEDGLSQGFIGVMHQDQEGFLWLGTKNGLNRYDGKQFELFTHDINNDYSISNDWIRSIHEKGDFLLIACKSKTINLFHKKTKRFYRVPLEIEELPTFNDINQILEDEQGDFWLEIRFKNKPSLLRLSFPERFWQAFPSNTNLLSSIETKFIDRIDDLHIYDHNFFISYEGQLTQLDFKTLTRQAVPSNFSPYRLIRFRKIAPKIGIGTPASNVRDNAHQIAILKNGIWQLLDTKLRFKHGYFHDESSDLIYLQSFTDDKVLVFKAKKLEQAEVLSESDADYIIPLEKGTVQSYLKDRSGVIWIGTGVLGIRKITPRKMAIRTYLRDASVSASLYALDSKVFYVASGKKQYYTEGGAAVIEEIRKASKFPRLQKLHWLHRGDSTWIIADQTFPSRDRRTLTIYTYEQGAVSKQKVIKVDFPEGDPMIHAINTLDGRLAIVTSRRLVFYDPTTKSHQIEAIDILPKSRLLCSQLAQTADGDFWLGSSQGLIHIQPNSDGYDYQLMSSEKNGLLNSNCSSLLIDPKDDNILWIGTVGGGLHRLDTRTMQFEYLNTRNGLPNDVIYGILNDEEGNLWMSSNKGIIRYTPETGVIRNFTAADGMQSNEFNTYAFGKSLNGELLFGGIAGLNIFHPNDLKDNPVVPKLSITGLEVNNQAVSVFDSTGILEKAIEFTASITLPFKQNNVNLRFAALEFSAPQKNQLSYYLKGAEKEWTHTTTDNQAAYLNLSPGKYTFKIKAANGDQV
ncbi:MAG: two-component regulator propeller domain-containing protein, partial [Bacteroidota bacterium]